MTATPNSLRYFTTAATRQALIDESKARVLEAQLRREHARLVALVPKVKPPEGNRL